MKWSVLTLLVLLTLAGCSEKLNSPKEETGAREALERDILMMRDPATGTVPSERLVAAKRYKDELVQRDGPLSGVQWTALGPNNQGGRSRTLLIDANDASGHTIYAGSVGGGLWKTTNITAGSPNWTPVNDLLGNLAVTSIAQDPGNPLIMYFCTGEGFFNGDAIRGQGVWKTTDGGASWNQLSSTNNSSFYYCQRIAVNSSGVVLVATHNGLQRSANGGSSWTKVLGSGLGITGASSNICYDVKIAANGDIYSSLLGSVHKSTDGGVTFGAAQTLGITVDRVELACAPSDANYVYAVCESGSVVAGILRSTNGGSSWTLRTEPNDADPGVPDADFSRQQAWYDLSLAVDPNNRDIVFTGGIDLFKSTDGAGSWTQISHWYGGFGYQYVHADQHFILFRAGSSSEAYFCNDGGVYRSTNANATTPTITDKGANYVTAQFYACAMHPTALTSYFLAGSQDNGSHQFSSGAMQGTIQVTGGDGAFCHIDQDQPQYQFTSYVNNNFYRSTDGGNSWASVNTTGGSFISPTDYDDVNNILYMCDGNNNYRRWNNPQSGNSFTQVNVTALNGTVTAVKVSPNTSNRVFFGSGSGRVVRVDGANGPGAPTATDISTGLPAAYVSCVEVQTGNDNHLLATFSNYGVNSIWESADGGSSWTSVEGNLPDMPVRWALFNPNNSDQAIIATELGVWSTDDLNGASTVWGASNSGLANVRVDMLQLRTSDKLVVAATHGRGLFSADIFTDPTALFEADNKVTYIGKSVQFTDLSYKGSSWSWDFGDGGSSTLENPAHSYANPGKYTVTLSINGGASSLAKSQYIHILPNKGTPYLIADGGGFESNPDHFGVQTVSGTVSWERGNSAIAGKNGTHAGSNAWVTGLTAANYTDNGETILLSPNYNFTLPGTYTLSFWSKFNTESDFDGFRVEYSLNKGTSWAALGTTTAAGWYNSANASGTTSFPAGEAFFSGTVSSYTQYSRDVSSLSGNSSVAFRFRFRSDVSVTGPGVAIDDIQVNGPANGALPLLLTSFRAWKQQSDAVLKWTTENEMHVSHFVVERSLDGLQFTEAGRVNARNQPADQYLFTDYISRMPVRPSGQVYYRIRMTDQDGSYTYSAVALVPFGPGTRMSIGPNPFRDHIHIYSSAEIRMLTLYDLSGKEVFRSTNILGNRVFIGARLPEGIYMARAETTAGTEVFRIRKGR